MTEVGKLYHEGRMRITDLVGDLSPEAERTPVPTCPEWTVHDVLAHVSGVCVDILTGNLDGVASDPWTEAQVKNRRDLPLADLLAEWDAAASQVEGIASAFPGRAGEQLVFDLTTHEHDIRHALGRPGARGSEAISMSVGFLVDMGLTAFVSETGVKPIEIVAGAHQSIVGDGEPGARLTVEPFELFRAGTGRRSERQIRAYDWSVDPTPYLPVFSRDPFTISPTDIVE